MKDYTIRKNINMNRIEINEMRAIESVMMRKQSVGYQRAIDAKIPVTYASGSNVVSMHNGKRTVLAQVKPSTKLRTPKTYILK